MTTPPASGTDMRLRLDIAYDGTDFHGWARQTSGVRTVQETIEDALALVLRTLSLIHI